jgi:soluble lytic murein transglycosylase-like protein
MVAGSPNLGRKAVRFAGVAGACFALLFTANAARADVLAIGDDGTVTVHSGPALYASADLKPQALPVERQSVARVRPGNTTAASTVRTAIANAAAHYALSPLLVSAVAWRESAFHANAVSPKGASGIMQLMPETARAYCASPCSPSANVEAGTAYLSALMQRYDGDIVKALAAYDAGPRAVDRYSGTPPYRETKAYVDAILARMSANALADTP